MRKKIIRKLIKNDLIEKDKSLNISLKALSYVIILFVVYSLASIKIRDMQLKKNLKVLAPLLDVGKLQILEKIREKQYIENMFMLLLVLMVAIASLYFFIWKYEKERYANE